MSQEDTPSAAIPPGKGLRIALVASLAVNLVVIGLGLGAWMHGPGGDRMDMDAGDGFRGLAWALPRETRHDLGREIFSRREEFKATRSQMAAARTQLADALLAEPFEIAAVEAAFARQKALLSGLADEGYRTLVAAIAAMSAAERAEFAGNLTRREPGPP
jgi:hypothetical protein